MAARARDEAISWYFSLGYSYKLIVCFLYYIDGVNLSLRQLKRILRYLGLRRRHRLSQHAVLQTIALMKVKNLAISCSCSYVMLLWNRKNSEVQVVFWGTEAYGDG